MSGHYEFVAVFETALLQGDPQKVVTDPLKIELLPLLPRHYRIDRPTLQAFASSEGANITQEFVLSLTPPRRYIVLTVRTDESDIYRARRECEDEIDRGLTILGAVLGSGIFGKLIHRGWVASRRGVIVEAWFRQENPNRLPIRNLPEMAKEVNTRFEGDSDLSRRFNLISRFYSKTLAEEPSEEVFLFLWTILEIYPMKDTTDIRPISELLSYVTGRDVGEVKDKLGIGRLFGMRSRLVHNGSLGVEQWKLGSIIEKLEDICGTVIREIIGLPYTGVLDPYFTD